MVHGPHLGPPPTQHIPCPPSPSLLPLQLQTPAAHAQPRSTYDPPPSHCAPPVGTPLDGPMMTSGKVFWRSDNGVIMAGIWEVAAGRMRADFGNDGEMVHVVKGTLHAIADDGTAHLLRPGDTAIGHDSPSCEAFAYHTLSLYPECQTRTHNEHVFCFQSPNSASRRNSRTW